MSSPAAARVLAVWSSDATAYLQGRPDFWGFARFPDDDSFEEWKRGGLWSLRVTLDSRPGDGDLEGSGRAEFVSAEGPHKRLMAGTEIEVWKPWVRLVRLTVLPREPSRS